MFKKIKPGFDIQYYQLHFKYFKFLRERCMYLSLNAYLEFEAVDVSYTGDLYWPLHLFVCWSMIALVEMILPYLQK